MYGICVEDVWDCIGYVWNLYEYVRNIDGIRIALAWNMYGMCMESVWNLHVTHIEFAWNEPCLDHTHTRLVYVATFWVHLVQCVDSFAETGVQCHNLLNPSHSNCNVMA